MRMRERERDGLEVETQCALDFVYRERGNEIDKQPQTIHNTFL